MRLHEIVHCRAGDKGDTTSILSVFPLDDADYDRLRRELTADRVRAHLAGQVRGEVTRCELPCSRRSSSPASELSTEA